MTIVNLSTALAPNIATGIASGTLKISGVVVTNASTKQVVKWAPALLQNAAPLCTRLGPAAPIGLAVVATIGLGALGYWAWQTIRNVKAENAALRTENADLKTENADLIADNASLQPVLGRWVLQDFMDSITASPGRGPAKEGALAQLGEEPAQRDPAPVSGASS
jgi:hypothetical protein